jgi:CheY-like chemotaxis protein
MKKTEKILVIDDEPLIRGMIVAILRFYGWTDILEAENGQEGVEMIKKHGPELVITDLTMPKMRGEEVLRWIEREHRPFHPIKTLAVSGDGLSPETESVVRAAGANSVLCKPFLANELKSAVEALLPSPPQAG